jgi:hypothetical protein
MSLGFSRKSLTVLVVVSLISIPPSRSLPESQAPMVPSESSSVETVVAAFFLMKSAIGCRDA